MGREAATYLLALNAPDAEALRRAFDAAGVERAGGGVERADYRLRDPHGRRRDVFVARVGDYTAPLSADHVYMYLHQTRWNEDNDDELAWHREREIARLQESWEEGDAPEPETG